MPAWKFCFVFLTKLRHTVNNCNLKSTGENFAFSYTGTAQKLYRQVHLVFIGITYG